MPLLWILGSTVLLPTAYVGFWLIFASSQYYIMGLLRVVTCASHLGAAHCQTSNPPPLQFTGWWPTSLSMRIQCPSSAVLSSSGALLAILRELWAPSATASSPWSSPSSPLSSSCPLRLCHHCRSWGKWRMPKVSPQWLLPCWESALSALGWGGPWYLAWWYPQCWCRGSYCVPPGSFPRPLF